jgi:hypothetical protein
VSDASQNTAGGTSALGGLSTGARNTAFGTNALVSNTTGHWNTASGVNALFNNTTGNGNTASGLRALFKNTTGSFNIASGFDALKADTTGNSNTASGGGALQANTTGSFNTASGNGALSNNTTGNGNTASGVLALLNNTTGSFNTASGRDVLFANTTRGKNTAVGVEALLRSSGNQNIAIGFRAGFELTNGNNNIYLDNVGGGDESQTMRLGDTQTRTFIAGIVSANVNGATVEIDANGQLGIKNSSARYKRDIAPMGSRSEKVLALRPVTFAYKDDARGVTHYGLIAEEVAAVYPDLVTRTATGEVQTVKYHELIPMLLNELQRQQQEFQQALQSQQRELAELRALMGQGREMGASSR